MEPQVTVRNPTIRTELERIVPRLRLYARSLAFSTEDADDLVSKTCIRVLERQAQFDQCSSLIAWAITILKNLYRDELKAERRRRETSDDTIEHADPLSLRVIESRLELSAVRRMIHQLPVEQREVLVMKGSGLSYDEIAAHLNIARGTVMSRLHRGRKALEVLMGKIEKVAS